MAGLAVSFMVVAFLYAMVGFGGGSSYIALLAFYDVPYRSIPIVALICNVLVVSGGTLHFSSRGHLRWALFWPFVAGSVPMALVGGWLSVSRTVFLWCLGCCLILVSIKLLIVDRVMRVPMSSTCTPPIGKASGIGAGLGFLSGLVGIGGGIFLAPVLLLLGWGKPKEVAATASAFILVNSVAGLAGQLAKGGLPLGVISFWPCFLAVLCAGQIGSRLGAGSFLPQQWVRDGTAVLVSLVGIRVLAGVA